MDSAKESRKAAFRKKIAGFKQGLEKDENRNR